MRILFLLCLCLVATSVHAEGWVTDTKTGCKIWTNFDPSWVKSINWSGGCEGGTANGQGVLREAYIIPYKNGQKFEKRITSECFLKNGKGDGPTTTTWETVDHPDLTRVMSPSGKSIGEKKDGKMEGKGTTFGYGANGQLNYKFVGEFNKGFFEKGTLAEANGDQYVGEFKYNVKDGIGTLTEANGDQYVGEFKENRKHGKGKFIFKGGTSYEGLWENGERIKIF